MKAFKQLSIIFLMTAALSIFAIPAHAVWTVSTSGTTQDLNGVHVLSPVKAFVSGNAGTIRVTNDGGTSWTAVAIPTVQDVNGIYFVDDFTGYAAVDNGGVLKTNDGGNVWSLLFVGSADNMRDLHFVDATTGYVVGENGSIFKTLDGGNTWAMQTSGTTERLESVYFTSASTGFAVGRNGAYLSTTNGGTTWTAGAIAAGADMKDVFFVDANNGFISRQNNFIHKTIDGGVNWSLISTNAIGNGFDAMHFVDANTGWGVNNFGFLAKSTTGGATWILEASGTTQDLNDIHCFDGGNCIAVGNTGTIITMLAPQGCITPSGLTTTNISAISATLNWTAVDAANSYEIQGREVGSAATVSIAVPGGTTNSFNVAGLKPGIAYEWQIRSICGPNDMSDFSAFSGFSTLECIPPSPVSTTNVTSTSARLNWTVVTEAQGYRIFGRELGSTQVASFTVAGGATSFFDVTGLAPGTTYEWSAASICNIPGALSSALANVAMFTTATSASSKAIDGFSGVSDVKVFPNPASNQAMIQWNSEVAGQQSNIVISDMKGAIVLNLESSQNSELIDLGHFSEGMYQVTIRSGSQLLTQKLVVY